MRLEECETEDAALGEEQANKVDEALEGVRSALDQIEAKGSRSMILTFQYLPIQAIGCDLTGGAEGSAIRRAGSD